MRAGLATLILLAAGQADAGTLVVRTEGIATSKGNVRIAVCNKSFDEAGCPWGANHAARGQPEEFVFDGLAPGRYAVAAYHDVNGNGELDTIPPGIPREPYAFSNDIGRFGPPRFNAALIDVGDGRTTVVLNLRRLLEKQ